MGIEPSRTPSEATLTSSDIARLANVSRAAVSNWRRRYADFPASVGGTPTSPAFDARDVDQWLHHHSRMQHVDTARQAWRHIESYRPAAQISDVLGIAGAFLLVRADRADLPTEGLPTPDQLISHLYTLDASWPSWSVQCSRTSGPRSCPRCSAQSTSSAQNKARRPPSNTCTAST
ncbi:hypothetical protein [Micromonospora sp. NBRC 101691]|uniref:helix-turn-helix transcriptional regulator n=1 Tax=Micromonospora sp. NBRC 101691 TaxID=3032198 RepID=UPI0024A26451|nr:hypothetical protein [Micromonospora sp. NBRC 101691]GLY21609.1 hypothetical protein Misp04_13410 [Micromonospora sp. NBRC 101691]